MENYFVTITGMNHYLGMNPYKVNRLVKLVKEPDNPHDPEAIRVKLPFIDTIGYVANSVNTVFAGTCSAGRLYDKFEDYTICPSDVHHAFQRDRTCSAERGNRE